MAQHPRNLYEDLPDEPDASDYEPAKGEYDPRPLQERTRTGLSVLVISGSFILAGLGLAAILWGPLGSDDLTKLTAYIAPFVGFTGIAIGFYFNKS